MLMAQPLKHPQSDSDSNFEVYEVDLDEVSKYRWHHAFFIRITRFSN